MNAAKIRLSAEEKELLMKADWILTKNRVIQKATALLGEIQAKQQLILDAHRGWLPEELFTVSAKISKGENYQGLPYLILDQPRYFSRDNIFAIRSFFWWGRFFSVTLHLAGIYKSLYEQKITGAFPSLSQDDFYVCINPDQWEHHFEKDNFIPLSSITAEEFKENLNKSPFVKLSKKISLEDWDIAEDSLTGIFNEYIKLLRDGN
jgi:hypothetical protein